MRCGLGILALAACVGLALGASKPKPKLEIFEPQVGAEYAKDQEIIISVQGLDFPETNRHAELLLDKKKVRNIPLPEVDGTVFNISLTGVKKGKHDFEIVLYEDKDVLDVWGMAFFVGSETARIRTKLKEARDKIGSKQEIIDSYLAWILNKGGDAEKVKPNADGYGGVGLFAQQDIEQYATIAEVPFITTLGPESAAKSLWKDFILMLYQDKDLPGQFASAVHLLLAADEDGNILEPMIRTLPLLDEMNVGINWDRHDNMRAVQILPPLTKLGHDIQEFFDRGYERFWAVLDMHEKDIKKLKKKRLVPRYSLFTRGNLLWAVSVIMTRAVTIPQEHPVQVPKFKTPPKGVFRIIPTADVSNMQPDTYHEYPPPPEGVPTPDGRLIITVNATTSNFVMVASNEIPKGSQIFISMPEMENIDMLTQFGYIMRPNLFDINLPWPTWVTGPTVEHPVTPRCARLSHIAPGAEASRFAWILNMTIVEGGEEGLRKGMDELFDAAVVHVPVDDTDLEGACTKDGGECRQGSQLIRDATYVAATHMKLITPEEHQDVKAAWETIHKFLEPPVAAPQDLPEAPKKQ